MTAASAIACLDVPCVAGEDAAPGGTESLVLMKGICRKLTTPARDLSRECKEVLVSSSAAREGRVGFHFGSGEAAVTFSGGTREIRVSDTMGVQTIDKVTIGPDGGARVVVAVGSCRYMNALTPKPTVSCKAETEEGNFLASFDVVGDRAPAPK